MNNACLPKCCCVKCVDDLNKVITKASLNQLKQYVYTHCQTALSRYDQNGRLPLHMAASCGKADVLEWIIKTTRRQEDGSVSIDVQDLESGWSALQRALYYGRIPCAMVLLKNGANMWVKDKDECNALDMVTRDISPWFHEPVLKRNSDVPIESWTSLHKSDPTEVYTWGVNENMTLAQGTQKSRKLPEVVEFFARKHISIKQVVMCKFHTIFLTSDGMVFSCGAGRGGRLGTGHDDVFIAPQPVAMGTHVIAMVAAATEHSVFITEDGQLFTCGLNHFRALGVNPPPEKHDIPIRVTSLLDQRIIGCAAGLCHTVAWTSNTLFTFGTNAGQLGHAKLDAFIILPRKVSSIHRDKGKILAVHACDSATVVATSQGIVFVLYDYVCRKINVKHLDISKVQVGGGKLDHTVLDQIKHFSFSNRSFSNYDKKSDTNTHGIKVLILKKSGDLIAWSSIHCTTDRCHFDSKQIRGVNDVVISNNGTTLIIVSDDGKAYFARYSSWQPGKRRGSSSHKQEYKSHMEMANSDSVQRFHVEQLPCIFRAHTAVIGPKGHNAGLLQCDPCNFITQVPVIDAGCLDDDLRALWVNLDADDPLHDVIIRVKHNGRRDVDFPAHCFVLATRSQLFSKLISASCRSESNETDMTPHEKLIIGIENVDPKIIKNILELVYCGKCELLKDGQNINEQYSDVGPCKISCQGNLSSSNAQFSLSDYCKTENKMKRKPRELGCLTLLKSLLLNLEIRNLKASFFHNLTIKENCIVGNVPSIFTTMPNFSSTVHTHLYDCIIMCDDSVTFSSHKCALSARIPYFRGMLLSPWIETKNDCLATLKVPIPSDIFRHVLDFAYADSPSSLRRVTNINGLCEVLAAADLLLMDKLKQAVEVQIVPLLTLKTITMVTEVALAFNGTQLYKSCLQFMCFHLPALLHTPSFHAMEMETLVDLEALYRSYLPDVYMRAMPASLTGPSVDHIPDIDVTSPEIDSFFAAEALEISQSYQSTSPKRRSVSESHSTKRKFSSKRSLGILISDLLNKPKRDEQDEILDQITASVPHIPTQPTSPPAALSTKPNAQPDKQRSNKLISPVLASTSPEQPVKGWGTVTPAVKTTNPSATSSSTVQVEKVNMRKNETNYENLFPQLGSESNVVKIHHNLKPSLPKSIPVRVNTTNGSGISFGNTGNFVIKPNKKLSKKERRQLKDDAETKAIAPPSSSAKPEIPNAWGVPLKSAEQSSESFWNRTRLDDEPPIVASPPSPVKSPPSNIGSGPWQRLPHTPTTPPITAPVHRSNVQSAGELATSPTSFINILQSEQLNKELREKIGKKQLALIQLEDQAMEELKRFYEASMKNVKNGKNFFTVSRLSYEMSRDIEARRKTQLKK